MSQSSEINSYVKLAKDAVSEYVKSGRVIDIPEDVPEELLNKCAGAFVCMKIDGQLRGCIGTIEPTQDCLAIEIIQNAINAASQDPRFVPVDPRELPHLSFSVDVLSEPEEVTDIRQLDPKRYGVIVQSGQRRGLLLPDLDGVDSVDQQIDIARRKAFIQSNEAIKLYRFEVLRYE